MTNRNWSDNQPILLQPIHERKHCLSEDTKEKIVAGAYRAIVRGGYASTSVKDIAAEAGVAPGLVHYYFATKADLLVAANEHCADKTSGVADQLAPLCPRAAARPAPPTATRPLRSEPYCPIQS